MSRKIEDLTQETQALYREFDRRMKEAGQDYIVTCTYRSQEDQDELWARGRTKPGAKVTWVKHSRHTDREAFDIARLVNGKVSWRVLDYRQAGKIGQEVGLTWGGSWKTPDPPHFELPKIPDNNKYGVA